MKKVALRLMYFAVYVFLVFGFVFIEPIDNSSLSSQIFKFVFLALMEIITIVTIWIQMQNLQKKQIKLKDETKTIREEICKFTLVYIADYLIIFIYAYAINLQSLSVNEIECRESLINSPIDFLFNGVILAPIIEESIFRFLPYQFIKNKKVYVIVSGFVFAILHCISSPNPIIYVPLYLICALYWGYKYCKTEDIFITMAMHSWNNLLSSVIVLLIQ